MSVQRLQAGPRMSQAVIYNKTVYLAGQVASGAPGGSVAEQTTDILASIDRLLSAASSDKSRLLSATIWLVDMASFAEMNRVWDSLGGCRLGAGARNGGKSSAGRRRVQDRDCRHSGPALVNGC